MADAKMNLCKSISGQVGPNLFSKKPNGGVTVKSMPAWNGSLKEDVMRQDACFGALGRLASPMKRVLRVSCPPDNKGVKCNAKFLKINKSDIVTATRRYPEREFNPKAKPEEVFETVVDFSRLLVSYGRLLKGKVTVTLDRAARKLRFNQEANVVDGADCYADDKAYAVVFDTTNEYCLLVTLRERGESGSTSTALDEEYDLDNLAIYTFMTTRSGKQTSTSQYLTLSEE